MKALVTYATRGGSTREVAEDIGRVLKENGWAAEVQPVRAVADVAGYDAVVVGSAIRAGHLMGEARRFVRRHLAALQERPVAFFVVCLTMREATAENRRKVSAWLGPLRRHVTPVAEGLFGGRVDLGRVGFLSRLVLRLVKAPVGDFRDWPTIRQWASDLAATVSRPAAGG